MGTTSNKIVSQAQAWLGTKEGSENHKKILEIYNSHKPLARGYKVKSNDDWCAVFVSVCSIQCSATDIIPTECGCQRMIDLFKKKGSWQENESITPKAGDIIFYDWQDNGVGDNQGWSDHVGIVEKVSGGMITTIEGNYGDRVTRRTIKVNAKTIRGYGIPKYDSEPKPTPTPPTPQPSKGYYAKYSGKSTQIDVILQTIGVPAMYRGSWKQRKAIASANGISGYTGTKAENIKLINLAKQGKLKKV